MTRRLVYGRYTAAGNRAIAKWVALRIPYVDHQQPDPFGACECIGVEQDRQLIAGVVLHMWDPVARVMSVSMAASTPLWARHDTILDILAVPFETAGARKIYTVIRSDNLRVIKLNKHLGFKEEGRLSEHYGPRLHAVILGMKRHHYERLKERFGGHRQGGQRPSTH